MALREYTTDDYSPRHHKQSFKHADLVPRQYVSNAFSRVWLSFILHYVLNLVSSCKRNILATLSLHNVSWGVIKIIKYPATIMIMTVEDKAPNRNKNQVAVPLQKCPIETNYLISFSRSSDLVQHCGNPNQRNFSVGTSLRLCSARRLTACAFPGHPKCLSHSQMEELKRNIDSVRPHIISTCSAMKRHDSDR